MNGGVFSPSSGEIQCYEHKRGDGVKLKTNGLFISRRCPRLKVDVLLENFVQRSTLKAHVMVYS